MTTRNGNRKWKVRVLEYSQQPYPWAVDSRLW